MSPDGSIDSVPGRADAPGRGTAAARVPHPDEHEFDHEPVRGLPGAPPEGERILWQGSPSWKLMAWRAFGIRLMLIYFGAIALWRAVDMWADGQGAEAIAGGVLSLVPVVLAVGAILALIGWATARAAVYTITNRRVAMRIGIVTTVTLNLPFRWIGSAALAKTRDGSGDIALSLLGDDRLAYLMLWPHVRPWKMRRSEPALRCLETAGPVAELLARAMREAQERRLAEVEAEPPVAADREVPTSPAPARQRPISGGLVAAE